MILFRINNLLVAVDKIRQFSTHFHRYLDLYTGFSTGCVFLLFRNLDRWYKTMKSSPDDEGFMQKQTTVRKIRTMPFCWIHKALFSMGLSWKAVITYTALSYDFNGSEHQEIPIKRMAGLVGVSERTIMRGLDELVKKKAITIKKQFINKNGKRQQLPNEYTMIDLVDSKEEAI